MTLETSADQATRRHPAPSRTYAAYTNQGFLLHEVSFTAKQLLAGASLTDVAQQVTEQNVFQLRSAASRKTILSAVTQRLEHAGDELLSFLAGQEPELKRLTNFYLILLRHRLLREFVAEVLHEELLQFSTTLHRGRVQAFFERKRVQESTVGGWSEQTLEKAKANILTVCSDAGLLQPQASGFLIVAQLVPSRLRQALVSAGREAYLPLLLDQGAR